MTALSRRAFVAGMAGGALAALWTTASCRPAGRTVPAAETAVAPYVDHDGWMLTPEDRLKLAATPLGDEGPGE